MRRAGGEHVMSDRVERKIVALLGDTLYRVPLWQPDSRSEDSAGKAEDPARAWCH